MEMTLQLLRTTKGQEEIFNMGHTLRPRHRQLLFCIGNGISFGELCKKHPKCLELEAMVNDLLQNGFIQALRGLATTPAAAPKAAAKTDNAPAAPVRAQDNANLIKAQAYVLEFMAALVGAKSPAYRHMSEARDLAAFNAALPTCRKIIAAVASPHQATEMEAGVAQHLAS